MATHTLNTAANKTLTCVAFSQARATLSDADLATVAQLIKDDQNPAHPVINGSFVREGFLYLPRRNSRILLLPGDVVAVDDLGWPIVVSYESIANGVDWTFT